MIEKLRVINYKRWRLFELRCNPRMNLLVGDNEAGKSTLLEAVNLVLTRRLNGRAADYDLTPHLFNRDAVAEYLASLSTDKVLPPPAIVIEAYVKQTPETAIWRGTFNDAGVDACGLRLEIAFDVEYASAYEKLLENPDDIVTVPIEFYRVTWLSFAATPVQRNTVVRSSFVDASTIRMQSGTDHYLNAIVNDGLEAKDRIGLALAYRQLKELFAREPQIEAINAKLGTKKGILSDKEVSVGIDVSSKGGWEASLVPHLGDIPYSQAGKGEQCALKIMFALDARAGAASVVLIEEPENHLSFSSLTILLSKLAAQCADKQVLIATHSAFVLNRLGLKSTILVNGESAVFLSELPEDTQSYFQRLSGYDTLRLILAKRSILVEGPSDELVIQKAYQQQHGKTAAADGVDVQSVNGLSFPRFLDIAQLLTRNVTVVTDNDGDFETRIRERYEPYATTDGIRICASTDNALPTLEDHIVYLNELTTLERLCGREFASKSEAYAHMKKNKTEWALSCLRDDIEVTMPAYVEEAVA